MNIRKCLVLLAALSLKLALAAEESQFTLKFSLSAQNEKGTMPPRYFKK